MKGRSKSELVRGIIKAIGNKDLEGFRRLVLQLPNINETIFLEYSPDVERQRLAVLHLVSSRGWSEAVEFLLAQKNVNKEVASESAEEDGLGRRMTPLHCAVLNGHLNIISILCRNKANLNAKTVEGLSPLYLAAIRNQKEVVRLFVNSGAKLGLDDKVDYKPVVRLLEKVSFGVFKELCHESVGLGNSYHKNFYNILDAIILRLEADKYVMINDLLSRKLVVPMSSNLEIASSEGDAKAATLITTNLHQLLSSKLIGLPKITAAAETVELDEDIFVADLTSLFSGFLQDGFGSVECFNDDGSAKLVWSGMRRIQQSEMTEFGELLFCFCEAFNEDSAAEYALVNYRKIKEIMDRYCQDHLLEMPQSVSLLETRRALLQGLAPALVLSVSALYLIYTNIETYSPSEDVTRKVELALFLIPQTLLKTEVVLEDGMVLKGVDAAKVFVVAVNEQLERLETKNISHDVAEEVIVEPVKEVPVATAEKKELPKIQQPKGEKKLQPKGKEPEPKQAPKKKVQQQEKQLPQQKGQPAKGKQGVKKQLLSVAQQPRGGNNQEGKMPQAVSAKLVPVSVKAKSVVGEELLGSSLEREGSASTISDISSEVTFEGMGSSIEQGVGDPIVVPAPSSVVAARQAPVSIDREGVESPLEAGEVRIPKVRPPTPVEWFDGNFYESKLSEVEKLSATTGSGQGKKTGR